MNLLSTLLEQITSSSILEISAVVFGVSSVWYAKKEHIFVYPTGIISVIIYVYICYNYKLYADMGINAYYFGMSVYGWILWTKKTDINDTLHISFTTKKERMISVGLFISLYMILIYVLTKFTDSDVPYWDSLTTSFFLVAMWLMANKKIENWFFWIIGDLISIPLYFYKGLVFTSVQFVIFTWIAIN